MDTALREGRLAVRYTAVSLIGFAIDATLLQLGLWAGLDPAWARVISLVCAMQATFAINSRHVFAEQKADQSLARRWLAYMATNGFGNLCNYWIFVTLVSLHARIVSIPAMALCAASACAWAINYASCRFLVFGRALRLAAVSVRSLRRRWGGPRQGLGPSAAAPGSPPR
jgi:putative flippase GtrA